MIYKLTYESDALFNFDKNLIEEVLKNARDKNVRLNITGCLVYYNGCFVQILEGEKKNINSLYAKIEKDPRHSNVKIIWKGFDDERSFSNWNMAFFDPIAQEVGKSDMKNFERNLLFLSEFSEKISTATNLFWLNVRKIILDLKIA